MSRAVGIIAALGALLCALATGQQPTARWNGDSGLASLRTAADEVLDALKAQDGERFASFVHPEKGVRFSPSAFVDPDEHVVLSRDQAARLWTDPKVYFWGHAEGSGDPIRLTPRAYADRYVYDRDYIDATSVTMDGTQAHGNTVNNAAEAYPRGKTVEYYFEPSAGHAEGGTDWSALRLVFEQSAGSWYLVAVIHDEWSP